MVELQVAFDSFARNDLDIRAWINELVEQEERGGDGGMEAVITKLELHSADINNELERSMVEIMANVPRTVRELDRAERAVQDLGADLVKLTVQLEDVDRGANAHVDLLARLDLTKSNMEQCVVTLREAANWSALVRGVHTCLASGDLRRAAEKLEGMTKSLEVLQGMPEAKSREETLADLQGSFESQVKPQLHTALLSGSAVELRTYVDLYHKLGKDEVLHAEYAKARPAAVHRAWVASEGEGAGASAAWVKDWYGAVGDMLSEEKRRASEVFGTSTASSVLCMLVEATFLPVRTGISARIAGEEGMSWPDAVASYDTALAFCAQALEAIEGATQSEKLEMVAAITAGYSDACDRWSELEAAYLQSQMEHSMSSLRAEIVSLPPKLASDPNAAFQPRVKDIIESSDPLFTILSGAVGRCMQLTGGASGHILLNMADELVAQSMRDIAFAVKGIRSLCGDLQAHQGRGGGKPSMPSMRDPSPAREDDDQEDFMAALEKEQVELGIDSIGDGFNWGFLSHPNGGALDLLRLSGKLQQRFGSFEQELGQALHSLKRGLMDAPVPQDDALLASSSSGRDLSLDDLRLLLARLRLQNDHKARADLSSTLSNMSSTILTGDLLGASARSVQALVGEAQSLVFDVCFCLVQSNLNAVPSLDAWSESAPPDAGAMAFQHDVLPQTFMTQIGEHLLSMLQQLEPFASGEALKEVCLVLADVPSVAEDVWKELGITLSLNDVEHSALRLVAEGSCLSDLVEGGSIEEDDLEDEAPYAQFCNTWLAAVARATVGLLIARVLQVPVMTPRGAEHLAADTAYLINVFNALDLSPHPLLVHMSRLAEMSLEGLLSLVEGGGTQGPGVAFIVVQAVERVLANARGAGA
ncbi:unnamed protein product [Chrysoparadoxa australica]